MSQNEFLTAQAVELTGSEAEPIHMPGSIQPHGILFVLTEATLRIVQVSINVFKFLGIPAEELLNKELKDLLVPNQINFIKQSLSEEIDNFSQIKISVYALGKKLLFNASIQRFENFLLFELEPIKYKEGISQSKLSYLTKKSINKIQKASNLQDLSHFIVKEVREITGFDRVMLYQFTPEGAGKVIAEDKQDDLISYLGLHYPASDIPQVARELYTLNFIRLIPDINYQAVEIVPAINPISSKPLDLSLSVLRSVSPCHIEYLNNMDVSASMSISLIRDKKLWGLIACHHSSPKYVVPEKRAACEFLGQVMSLELAAKEENENLEYEVKLKSILSEFIAAISQDKEVEDGLVRDKSKWLDLVNAGGVALCANGCFTLIGETPAESEIQELIKWIETKINHDVFHTDSLPIIYPRAEEYKTIASGLLALSISKVKNNYIFWFRPEVIQTVNWGGNPNQPFELTQDKNLCLSPRKSFELWKETVRLKSLPWKRCEIDIVLELRNVLVDIVLRNADELAKINANLARSNSELDAFAYIASHDLKEPLRGIHNYSNFLMEDYMEVLDEEGISKLKTLVRLTQRMEDLIDSLLHFSRLGRVELSMQKTDLNELVKTVIEVLSISLSDTQVDIRIPRPLPVILCDRIQVNEVFTNLIGNAIKYNDKADKWVETGFVESESEYRMKSWGQDITLERESEHSAYPSVTTNPQSSNPIIFYVRDNGIGIKEKHLDAIFRIFKRLHPANRYGGGTGAGLTIAKKIVERHGGKIWVESRYGEGSTFYFTLHS